MLKSIEDFLVQNIYLFLGEYKNIQMLEQKYFHFKKNGKRMSLNTLIYQKLQNAN